MSLPVFLDFSSTNSVETWKNYAITHPSIDYSPGNYGSVPDSVEWASSEGDSGLWVPNTTSGHVYITLKINTMGHEYIKIVFQNGSNAGGIALDGDPIAIDMFFYHVDASTWGGVRGSAARKEYVSYEQVIIPNSQYYLKFRIKESVSRILSKNLTISLSLEPEPDPEYYTGRLSNIPTMKVVSGSEAKRNPNQSFGDIRYNTDNNYIEIHHADNNNSSAWRELITNNKSQIDISGKLMVSGDLSVNGNIIAQDASFNKIGEYNTDNGITFLNDVSFNGNVVSNDGDLGFAGKWHITAIDQSAYIFTGNGLDGDVDNPTIYLMRGSKYKFINTTGSHPFGISRQLDNPGNASYNKGFIGGTTSTFNVSQDAPDELYYYCTTPHDSMKGTLKIIGEGGGGGGIESGTDVSLGHIDATSINVTGNFEAENITTEGDINVGSSGIPGEITATGDITAFYNSSDKRLKTNVTGILDYEHIIKNINGVRFNWNENAVSINPNVDLSKVELGVIAQEIEEYMPEIIKVGIDNYKAVRYEKIIPILIECIKDLHKKIEILQNIQ